MKDKLLKLYRECFPEDSTYYSEYYIDNKFDGKNAYVFTEGEQPVSMLLLLNNTLVVGNKEFSCPFMAAVGTKPTHRKRGLARKLIMSAFTDLRNKGEIAVSLYPENAAFYAPLGFVTYAYSDKFAVKSAEEEAVGELSFEDAEGMLKLYEAYAKQFYAYEKRDYNYFIHRIAEFMTEGKVVGFISGGEVKAYAMYFDKSDVDEVVYSDPFYLDKLGITNYRVPKEIGRGESMIRVLNTVKFLETVGYNKDFNVDLRIKISDEIIKENNEVIRWTVNNGVGRVEKLSSEAEYDVDYLQPDLISTVMRSGVNLSLLKY